MSDPSAHTPAASVVIPAFGRPDLLRCALASVAAQTLADFECIVVDDGSAAALEPIVDEFDDRFVCVRRERNGGPVAARLTGYRHVRAPVVAKLDSDDELLPRALARAVELLAAHPEADAVIGLAYLGGRLPLRVAGGLQLVRPEEYVRRSPPPFDVADVFRAEVVREWVRELPEFYKEEFAFKLMLGLGHNVLYVDEAWDVHHADAPDRMSRSFDDRRWLDDVRVFVAHFRPRIGSARCAPLDQYLSHRRYLLARRGHRKEVALVDDWLRERGVTRLSQARILLRTRLLDRRSYRV